MLKRLMIADDEKIIRDSLSKMIDWESYGYQLIGTARNGMEAYDMICNLYPDVIISDIRMPLLSGLEMIRRALSLDQDLTFVILSGYGEFEYAREAMELGVKYFLLKPTNIDELKRVLQEISESYVQKEARRQQRMAQLYREVCFPIQKAMLTDALLDTGNLEKVLTNYRQIFEIHESNIQLCVCLYVGEDEAERCLDLLRRTYRRIGVEEYFPPIYVGRALLLTFRVSNLTVPEKFLDIVQGIHLPGQETEYEAKCYPVTEFADCFQLMIRKISRFNRILILDQKGIFHEVYSNNRHISIANDLYRELRSKSNRQDIARILLEYFSPDMEMEAAYALSICLMIQTHQSGSVSLQMNMSSYLGKIYEAKTVSEIREITEYYIVLLLSGNCSQLSDHNDLIGMLKDFVGSHLDAEYLSLKWLAENYLFVSISYLSRQFTKIEGKSFSEYLNQVRMEKAKEMMRGIPGCTVQDVAAHVGFASNPGYFSQVFRKYEGITPSAFLENCTVNLI
ncbi:MAG: response regulator transcription factor [Candidatus Merdivicinus sp.]|jgi:two-component system response regulator YesN